MMIMMMVMVLFQSLTAGLSFALTIADAVIATIVMFRFN